MRQAEAQAVRHKIFYTNPGSLSGKAHRINNGLDAVVHEKAAFNCTIL